MAAKKKFFFLWALTLYFHQLTAVIQYFFNNPEEKLCYLAKKLNLPLEEVRKFEFKYLTTEAFKTRSALAAYLLRDCEEIIEIGSYKTPISDFLQHKNIKVIAIDPRTPPQHTENIECLPILFQDWQENITHANYGVLLLGLDLHMPDEGWQKLYQLINKSKKTLVEFPRDYPEGVAKFNRIKANVTKKVSLIIKMDFSETLFPKFERTWGLFPLREVYLFK